MSLRLGAWRVPWTLMFVDSACTTPVCLLQGIFAKPLVQNDVATLFAQLGQQIGQMI